MEIERINENTVKFFISYLDIEERGFNREEIWYNRERSEELFWEMMDEVHDEEEFVPEGPLWIQVQALDKGLEVLVTKAQLSKDGNKFELPIPEDKLRELPLDENIEAFLDENFYLKHQDDQDEDLLDFVICFQDFENVLMLAKRPGLEHLQTKLYSFRDHYYLYIEFPEELFAEEAIDNVISILLEYGKDSLITSHYLAEYGNVIIEKDVFHTLNQYFD